MTQIDASFALETRQGLPEALRVLIDAYPRGSWEEHGNFREMIQFWMKRHMMFRQLSTILRQDAEQVLEGDMDLRNHAGRLSQYGGTLLNELHTHHQVEDAHYFPQLIRLEPRLERGFELLETDHEAMDGLLHGMADAANAVLQGGSVGVFSEHLAAFSALLERHLTDEEDIVVPVVLHSGFNG